MKLKITLFSIALTFFTLTTFSQTNPGWVWAQRGGSAATFDYGSGDWGMERILDIAIDNANNYYYLAEVAGYTFTLGGMEFDTYNDFPGKRDIFVFSTDSDGDYRWGKTIGGALGTCLVHRRG